MSARLRRVRFAATALMRQNRLLLACLVLWPCALTGVLIAVEDGRPSAADSDAILQQELLYGLALVALRASTALGAEQKAGRLPQLLGRALGRGELLAAMGTAILTPFLGYVAVWAANAALLSRLDGQVAALAAPVLTVIDTGVLLCAAGLLFSAVLPQAAASVATGAVLAGGMAAGLRGLPVAGPLMAALFGSGAMPWGLETGMLLMSAAIYASAIAIFRRRDLHLG